MAGEMTAGATDGRAPAPMEAGGFYNRHAVLQASAGARGLPLIERAFAAGSLAAVPSGGFFTIADYGCAQGANSLAPVALALRLARGRIGAEAPVCVVHADQPGNDFGALLATLRDHPASYLKDDPNVFASCVGGSFYGALLPPGSVDHGWCSFAAHWLSASPRPAAGHVWPHMAAPAVRKRFATRSAADWTDFLARRARELKPGGSLVVVQPVLPAGAMTTFPVLMAWVQAELDAMADAGLIAPDERERMTILVYERRPEEVRAPFSAGSFEGLDLVAVTVEDSPDPFWPAYLADGDAAALADRHLGFFRAPFNPSLVAALDPGRDADFRAAFTARLEAGLRARMLAAPQPLLAPLDVHAALMTKRAGA